MTAPAYALRGALKRWELEVFRHDLQRRLFGQCECDARIYPRGLICWPVEYVAELAMALELREVDP